MIFAAIDPGKTGGFSVIDEKGIILSIGNFIDFKTSFGVLSSIVNNKRHLILLEKVHAFPGQGVSSMFTFGANYGGWKALLEVYELSFLEISPQTWQKKVLGSVPKGEAKQRAREYIKKRYPKLELKKTDDAITDSLCMALYLKLSDN